MKNKLTIIGGQWRSRSICFNEAEGLRPTASRMRETLFNWLQHDVWESVCLDLYAGSGALGFEAASRGAKQVTQVESNPWVYQQLVQVRQSLGAEHVTLVRGDAFHFLADCKQCFDLVFIDPPFHQGLAGKSCQWLERQSGLLRPNAKIYLEVEHKLVLPLMPEQWRCLRQKSVGEVDYYLFQRHSSTITLSEKTND